jgi:hypothetical protein
MDSAAAMNGIERLKLYLIVALGVLVVVLAVSGWIAVLHSVASNAAKDGAPPTLKPTAAGAELTRR